MTDTQGRVDDVPEEAPLTDDQRRHLESGFGSILSPVTIYRLGWKSCRSAMLAAAPSPSAESERIATLERQLAEARKWLADIVEYVASLTAAAQVREEVMPIAAVGPHDPTTISDTPPGPAPDTQGRADGPQYGDSRPCLRDLQQPHRARLGELLDQDRWSDWTNGRPAVCNRR